MLICPKCKYEYEEGYRVCSDCGCDLVEVPEPDEEEMLVNKASKAIGLTEKLLIFGAVFVIGIIILMSSISLADIEMSKIMASHGGSMDTNKYLIYLEQAVIEYRTLGAILSLLSGLGVLMNTRVGQMRNKE
jgi:hypothetical protein